MTRAFKISMKKAPTSGTTRKAFGDGPKRLVTASMLAIAMGVAPRPRPTNPADRRHDLPGSDEVHFLGPVEDQNADRIAHGSSLARKIPDKM